MTAIAVLCALKRVHELSLHVAGRCEQDHKCAQTCFIKKIIHFQRVHRTDRSLRRVTGFLMFINMLMSHYGRGPAQLPRVLLLSKSAEFRRMAWNDTT